MDSIAEGFNATPALYGSTVRRPGRLDGFKSGMKEGGKVTSVSSQNFIRSNLVQAFFFGVSDGLTGLWTEPANGYKTGVSLVRLMRK
jgi:sterol 3beta-glucosyltransferase